MFMLSLSAISLMALHTSKSDPGNTRAYTYDEIAMLLVTGIDNLRDNGMADAKLTIMGDLAFPAYEKLLNSKDTYVHRTVILFDLLYRLECDRSRFLETTIEHLQHKQSVVKIYAVNLMEKIGSANDTAPLIALLSDQYVHSHALRALLIIGDKRTVSALGILIDNPEYQQRKYILDATIKTRDALQLRLEKEKSSKPKP